MGSAVSFENLIGCKAFHQCRQNYVKGVRAFAEDTALMAMDPPGLLESYMGVAMCLAGP